MAPAKSKKDAPRSHRPITDFFQPRSSSAALSSSPAPSTSVLRSTAARVDLQPMHQSKAATRVIVKPKVQPEPTLKTMADVLALRDRPPPQEVIEISDRSHISISSGSPSPRTRLKPLLLRNSVMDLTTPPPPKKSASPIVISSRSASRSTTASRKRVHAISDTDTDVQILEQPPAKRLKSYATFPSRQMLAAQRTAARPAPAPPPASSSQKMSTPASRPPSRPNSVLRPVADTSSEESSTPYTPFIPSSQSSKALNRRAPLTSSNSMRHVNSPLKPAPRRAPSRPQSQNVSPTHIPSSTTAASSTMSTQLRKRASQKIIETDEEDWVMPPVVAPSTTSTQSKKCASQAIVEVDEDEDWAMTLESMGVTREFMEQTAQYDAPYFASPPPGPAPLPDAPPRLSPYAPRTPVSISPKASRPPSGRPPARRTPRRSPPAAVDDSDHAVQSTGHWNAEEFLKQIEADSASSDEEGPLDYAAITAEADTLVQPSRMSPESDAEDEDDEPSPSRSRSARRRGKRAVVLSTDSERGPVHDEPLPAARRRAAQRFVVMSTDSERDPARAPPTEATSTEEVSDSEPEGTIPRFPQRDTAADAALPPLSSYSTLTSLGASPQKAKLGPFPSSAFGSPLTELGQLSPARLNNGQFASPTSMRTPVPHTPKAGEPSRLEVVVPPVAAVAKAGLSRFNTAAKTRQTTLNVRTKRIVPARSAAPAKPDGGSVIERLLQQKRAKEALAQVEAEAEAVKRAHREDAQRIRNKARLGGSPGQPRADVDSDDDEADLRRLQEMDEDARGLLDSEQRNVVDTLVGAVGDDEHAGWCAKVGYAPFWEDTSAGGDAMAQDVASYATFTDAEVAPELAKATQDRKRLVVFLAVASIQPSVPVLTWLVDTALSADAELAVLANDQLQTLLRLESGGGVHVPLTALLKPLVRFGARREAVDAIMPGFYDTVHEPNFRFVQEARAEFVRAWSALLEALARAGYLPQDDVPALVLAMLLVALDRGSSLILLSSLMTAVENVCALVVPAGETAPLELDICRHIWTWAQSVTLPIRARILDLIPGGRCLARMGRWLAHAFLTGADLSSMTLETYTEPPPLDVLVPLLSQTRPPKDVQSDEPFAPFVICAKTDYHAMGHYVDLLARSLMNIVDYYTAKSPAPACDLEQTLRLLKRLSEKLPSGVKGGNVVASAVQQILTQLHISLNIQIINITRSAGQRNNVLDYLASPKKAGGPSASDSEG